MTAHHNNPALWAELASTQAGLLSRAQLRALGLDRSFLRNQVRASRWQEVGPLVVATTTGPLSRTQRLWAGILNAGEPAAVGGLTAGEIHGLRNWSRQEHCIVVPKSEKLPALDGVRYVETRRDIEVMRSHVGTLPVLRLEPAALLFAAYDRSERTACGLLAALVQQRLTDVESLLHWVGRMRPLRRSRVFRVALADIAGGAQSMSELDIGRLCRRHDLPPPRRQVRRRDRDGTNRYTDCEWLLPDGRTVVLEVDGAFHMDVERWTADMARERDLVVGGRVVLRCTSCELRSDPVRIVNDLRALGIGRGRPYQRGL